LFLVHSLTVAIFIIFYLFYFNRVLGWLIAQVCNFYLRRNNYKATVEFEAIQVSPLAGRILFKNLRYHSVNQCLRILKAGHITCRYWYLRTQGMKLSDSFDEGQLADSSPKFPYRWIVAFEGAEWFVYNRTAAFDVILEHLNVPLPESYPPDSPSESKPLYEIFSNHKRPGSDHQDPEPSLSSCQGEDPASSRQTSDEVSMMGWALRDALPIKIEGQIGVITIGNKSTQSILIVAFDRTHGIYSAPSARSRHDFFRQDFQFCLFEPKIMIRTNPDYNRSLKEQGTLILHRLKSDPNSQREFEKSLDVVLSSNHFTTKFYRFFALKRSSGFFNWLFPKLLKDQKNILKDTFNSGGFHGLPRFVQTDPPTHPIEYAKVTTILTARQMNFRYYLDSPGKVPADPLTIHNLSSALSAENEDGLPPEYGVDVKLIGGHITYGPWADRQRSDIQKAFLPPQRHDSVEISGPSGPGDPRAHTELVVKIELEDSSLRIPIREASKDWRWLSANLGIKDDSSSVRKYGWLDLFFGSRSEIVIIQSQIPQKDGYQMILQAQILDLEVKSSVNKKTFVKVPLVTIKGDFPTPLAWDAPRTWAASISFSKISGQDHQTLEPPATSQPQISLLRDHIQLLTDLVKDWISGPPTAYEEWVPTNYAVELNMSDYELCLHLNDLNIIENFDLEAGSYRNTLLFLNGPTARISTTIAGELYRPPILETPFKARFDRLVARLEYPQWSTQNSFATASAIDCAELGCITVTGSYNSNDQIKPSAVDFLSLNLEMEDIIFKAFGHLFRLLLNIKDNYFGTFNHFVTRQTFGLNLEVGRIGEGREEVEFRESNSNIFELDLRVLVKNLLFAFPEDPFDCEEVVFCHIPSAICNLRNHNYFMSMDLKTDPLKMQPVSGWESNLRQNLIRAQVIQGDFCAFVSQSCVRIDSIQVTGLRLFGPPPDAVAYLGDWKIEIGNIVGEVAVQEFEDFERFAKTIKDGFVDQFNSLMADLPQASPPDATIARLETKAIDLVAISPRTRARLHLPHGFQLLFNDLCSDSFQTHLELVVPLFGAYLLVPDPRGDTNNPTVPWLEVASIKGNLEFGMADAPLGWEKRALAQRTFLQREDFETRRCPFLYNDTTEVEVFKNDLTMARKDILDSLRRGIYQDPHAINNSSDDEESTLNHTSWEHQLSGSDNERSETDEPRKVTKTVRRERLKDQRRPSMLLGSRNSLAANPPIAATPYATALPSWRYYGFDVDLAPEFPLFLPMRTGLFPPKKSSFSSAQNTNEAIEDFTLVSRELKDIPEKHTEIGRKYLNVQMKTPLDLFLTPLFTEAVNDVLETISDNTDVEGTPKFKNHILSALNARSSSPVENLTGGTIYELYVNVPLVRIRIIQDILSTLGPPSLYPMNADSPLLSAMSLQIGDVILDGKSDQLTSIGHLDSVGLPRNTSISIGGLEFSLSQANSSIPSHFFLCDIFDTPSVTVLNFQTGSAHLSLSHDGDQFKLSLTTSKILLSFVESAAETLAGSYASIDHYCNKIKSTLSNYQTSQHGVMKGAILGWISNDSDSLPSCLVQSPFWVELSSRSNRSSFSWYCSARLRHLAFVESNNNRRSGIQPARKLHDQSLEDVLIRWSSHHSGDADVGTLDRFLPRIVPRQRRQKTDFLARLLRSDQSFLFDAQQLSVCFFHGAGSFKASFDQSAANELLVVPPTTILAATKFQHEDLLLSAHVHIGIFKIRLDPQLSSLAQHILNVINAFKPEDGVTDSAQRNVLKGKINLRKKSNSDDLTKGNVLLKFSFRTQVAVAIRGGRLQAVADQLGVLVNFKNFCVSFHSDGQGGGLLTANQPRYNVVASLKDASLRFCEISPSSPTLERALLSENLLISGSITEAFMTISLSPMMISPTCITDKRLVFISSVSSLTIRVRRSLVKLEEFVRDWKRQEVASRIAPIYHKLKEALKLDHSEEVTENNGSSYFIRAEFQLGKIHANFQPIPRLEVAYDLSNLTLMDIDLRLSSGKFKCLSGGLMLSTHTLSFTSATTRLAHELQLSSVLPEHRGLIKLPNLQLLLLSHLEGDHLTHMDLEVDHFDVYLSIDWIDTLLTMSSRYGEDLSELFHLLRESRSSKASCRSTAQKQSEKRTLMMLHANFALAGFELSFVGSKPMPQIDCRRVKGSITPHHRFVELNDCAISLLPPHPNPGSQYTMGTTSLASFKFNLLISNRYPSWASKDSIPSQEIEDSIQITADFQRVQAVAATSAFKLLLDCVQHLQDELGRIKELRRTEMAEAGARLEKVWRYSQSTARRTKPLTQRLIFAGRCMHFGLAIPLDDLAVESNSSADGSESETPSPSTSTPNALLLSFTQLVTSSRLGQTARASVELFAIQAVSSLDPSFVEHFESSSFETRNSVFVPYLDVRFGLTSRPEAAKLLGVKASAPNGITIDLSPSIVLILYAFLDVYQRDYHLMMNFFERQQSQVVLTSRIDSVDLGENSQSAASLLSTITDPWAVRFDFDTGGGGGGKIQLHTFDLAEDDADFVETLRYAHASLGRLDAEVAHSDIFYLPGVSAWAMYDPVSNDSNASLHIDLLVHSSRNTLNPTLLRFVSQMSAAVVQRHVQNDTTATFSPATKPNPPSTSSLLSTNLSFSLRIDQSELTITCLPTRALAKLQWASGVMFVSGRMDENRFNAACTISKISAFLRHEHGFDSALKAEAGDLMASLSWKAVVPARRRNKHICSIVVEFSELLTEVDFNHLDICLLFKTIWLEPVTPSRSELDRRDEAAATVSVVESPVQRMNGMGLDTKIFLVAVLVDNIRISLGLSAGIGTVNLVTKPLSMRLRHVPGLSKSFCFDVGETIGETVGDGSLGGSGRLQFFSFMINVKDCPSNTILNLSAILGPIEVNLAAASETILLLCSQLVEGSIKDDWEAIKSLRTDSSSTEIMAPSRSLNLNIFLDVQSIHAIITLYTFSRGKSLLDSVENQLREQNAKAEAVLRQLSRRVTVEEQKKGVFDLVKRSEGPTPIQTTGNTGQQRVQMVGSLDLVCQNFSIALFAGQFGDLPLLRTRIKFTRALLLRVPSATEMSHSLDFTTEGCQIEGINLAPNCLTERDQIDGSWYQTIERAPTEMVLDSNRLWISMISERLLSNKNEVHHIYRAEMPNNIHISTDITTHANIWSKFRSAWGQVNESKGSKRREEEEEVEVEVVVLVAKKRPVIEDAKVKELWHAALPLVNYFKWNENLPRYTLIWVIRPLDRVVNLFEDIYRSSFNREGFVELCEGEEG
ncbi:hypothetical protein PPACK8108_LOCUS12834, partial [Phakopsora pachyrhizi]